MAAATINGEGRVVTITAGGTITKGTVYEGAGAVGIYLDDVVSGDAAAILIEGEVTLDKEAPLVINFLDTVYWAADTDEVTKTATDLPLGICTQDAASAATRVRVKLNAGGTQA